MKKTIRRTLARTFKAPLLAALMLSTLVIANEAAAGSAVWQETDIEYLWGGNFKTLKTKHSTDDNRSTITVEHADAWKYGDNFFFFDITNPETDRRGAETGFYGEISPRLSIGKITGMDLSAPYLKDVLVAATLEVGDSPKGFHNYLYGVGLSLNLPKFNFADLNLYVRNDPRRSGVTYQITPVWQLPFTIGNAGFLFEGFADIAGKEADSAFNIDCQPRLLLDLGRLWEKPGNIYLGTEFMYWHNKYGIEGIDEYAPQVMVKWAL